MDACSRCGETATTETPLGRRVEIRCAECGLFLAAPLTAEGMADVEHVARMADIIAAGLAGK